MQRPFRLSLAAATALLLLIQGTASAQKVALPFASTGEAALAGDPFTGTTYSFAGQATYVGPYTGGGQVKFSMLGSTLVSQGTATFVATDGSKLFASFTAYQVSSSGELVGPFVFTGGTGRFAGASGAALVFATPESATTFTIDVYGELRF